MSFAVKKCPFLHAVCEQQGEQYARRVAVGGPRPVLEEPAFDFASTFRLFHGQLRAACRWRWRCHDVALSSGLIALPTVQGRWALSHWSSTPCLLHKWMLL